MIKSYQPITKQNIIVKLLTIRPLQNIIEAIGDVGHILLYSTWARRIKYHILCYEFLCNHFTNVRNVSLALACYEHSFTLPDNICWARYVNKQSTLLPSWGTMCPKPDTVIVTQRRFGLIEQIPIHNIFIQCNINTLRPRQDGHRFADYIFKWFF